MTEKQFTLAYLLNNEDDDWWAVRNGEITLWKEEVVDLLNEQDKEIQAQSNVIKGYQERNEKLFKQTQELQERNNRQAKLIEKQQEQINNYIDIKAKLNGKIEEYTTKSEEYELGACACGSRKYAYKTDALIEFKEEVFKDGTTNSNI